MSSWCWSVPLLNRLPSGHGGSYRATLPHSCLVNIARGQGRPQIPGQRHPHSNGAAQGKPGITRPLLPESGMTATPGQRSPVPDQLRISGKIRPPFSAAYPPANPAASPILRAPARHYVSDEQLRSNKSTRQPIATPDSGTSFPGTLLIGTSFPGMPKMSCPIEECEEFGC